VGSRGLQIDLLRDMLERVYARYNHKEFIGSDPLQFIYRYKNRRDWEIVGFLASALAYGRVQQIERSLTQLFDRMDGTPYEFTLRFDSRSRARLRGFKHRFTTGDDISDLLTRFRRVLDESGSLEAFFLQGYRSEHATVLPALTMFCESLTESTGGKRTSSRIDYLLASPRRGSACKRLNLFLRWMVRQDEVDVGLWKHVDKAKLIVPVDVHMGRLCRILGFHDGKSATLAATIKITEAFAQIEPADPAKYDFALSRIGIVEGCDGRPRPECLACELSGICLRSPHGRK